MCKIERIKIGWVRFRILTSTNYIVLRTKPSRKKRTSLGASLGASLGGKSWGKSVKKTFKKKKGKSGGKSRDKTFKKKKASLGVSLGRSLGDKTFKKKKGKSGEKSGGGVSLGENLRVCLGEKPGGGKSVENTFKKKKASLGGQIFKKTFNENLAVKYLTKKKQTCKKRFEIF